MIDDLLKKFPLVSDQVDKAELKVILRELDDVLGKDVDGDIVELGCYKGTTSLFLSRLLLARNSNKKLYLYDSFAGLPSKTTQDNSTVGDQFVAGELTASKNELVMNFIKSNLPRPIVKKAWFSDLSPSDMPNAISFAFFDGDFYESIRDSFAVCDQLFSPGATIVVDDYASEALPGAARATDEWASRNSSRVKSFRVEQSLGLVRIC